MKWIKQLFCLHNYQPPNRPQKTRGAEPYGLRIEYEFRCVKCNKIHWSGNQEYSNTINYIEPN